ncbi:hypothetical protein NVP1259O_33 [Vibrio phage 1.259.O._10N.286.48.F4]|nr:hypothetical protein NVP1259O_33 [Vibrio phage 1.259.O._10N.286.48.F4]
MCDYQGHEFGAHYEDACCIDGFLWDLDSGGIDDNGNSYLDAGGDLPCPKCNPKKRVKYLADDLINDGYDSLDHPLTTKMVKNVLAKLPSNQRRMAMRYWRAGRNEAIKEAMKEG